MKNKGLEYIKGYNNRCALLPSSNKMDSGLIGDSIIGIRPDETWEHAIWRNRIEQRVKKINKIQDKIKKGS